MFDLALKANIPIIGVTTDDLPNCTAVLQTISGRKVLPWPHLKSVQLGPYLYYTDSLDAVTVDNYRKLAEGEYQLIVINPPKTSSLIFFAGELPTPKAMIEQYLKDFVAPEDRSPLLEALKGLSLKTASETVQLTMARTGAVDPKEVRRTRTVLGGSVQGLHSTDTTLDFYIPPVLLENWLKTNTAYFNNPATPQKLVPRGLLLSGPPGVGKSVAAKAIANHFGVPLYRLDMATTLGKYIGESEARIASSLNLIERESPCVLLIDEVEKLFGSTDDHGVTARILSQLLWWLADHKSRVLTVMTTNNKSALPPELYRPGRLDQVLDIQPLTLSDAKVFSRDVYIGVMGTGPSLAQDKLMTDALIARGNADAGFSPAEIEELVYRLIKEHGWWE